MAGRRCGSCGADVKPFAATCPVCGADPDVTIVELGPVLQKPTLGGPSPRGRLRVWPIVVAVVGAWALFAGLGSLQDDGAGDAGDEERAAATTSSTRPPPRVPTKTVAPVLTGAPLLGEPTGLHVLVGSRTGLIDIDLDEGVIERRDLPGQIVDGDERGVLIKTIGRLTWYPFPLDAATGVQVAEGADWAWLLEGAGAAWVMRGGTDEQAPSYEMVGLDGSGARTTAELPPVAYPVGVAGDLLVVAAVGHVYTIDQMGVVADLGVGVPSAVGSGYVVVDQCDAELRCGRVVVDVSTGETRSLAPSPVENTMRGSWVGPGGLALDTGYGPVAGGLFVVDGDSVVTLVDPDGQPATDGFGSAAFSPDGRWVAALANRSVVVGPTTAPAMLRHIRLEGAIPEGNLLLVPI